MKEFVLNEAELDKLSILNTLASTLFSFAAASFFFALGLLTSAIIQGTLTERASGFVLFGEWAGFLLSALFLAGGIWAFLAKRSTLSEIKEQAVPIDQISTIAETGLQRTTSNEPTPDKEGSQT